MPLFLFLGYAIVWLYLLWVIVSDPDMKPLTRLTWLAILILVPFGGALLFMLNLVREPVKNVGLTHTPEDNLIGTPWEHNPWHTFGRNTDLPSIPEIDLSGTPWEHDPSHTTGSKS